MAWMEEWMEERLEARTVVKRVGRSQETTWKTLFCSERRGLGD